MSIRINKVSRDYNVGIATVVEFLQKKGFDVENSPNAKIDSEQYALLTKEFGKGFVPSEENKSTKEPKNIEKKAVKAAAVNEVAEESHITVASEVVAPKIVIKGHIDLDANNKKKTAKVAQPIVEVSTPTVAAEKAVQEPAPVVVTPKEAVKPAAVIEKVEAVAAPVSKPVAAKLEEVKEVKEVKVEANELTSNAKEDKKEVVTLNKTQEAPIMAEEVKETDSAQVAEKAAQEVFRLNSPKLESAIKVTGKIDLTALNQSTRPKKKTKEERKKERDDKRPSDHKKPQLAGAPKAPVTPATRPTLAKPGQPGSSASDEAKKKRKRINKERVNVDKTPGTNAKPNFGGPSGATGTPTRPNTNHSNHPNHPNNGPGASSKPRLRKPMQKTEVSDEDVQKQIKETLARLTNKGKNNNRGAKHRRDKRDLANQRHSDMMEQEEMESRTLQLTEFVTANDLANMMDVAVTQVIGTCMSIGMMVSINQRLDAETINIVAEEFGFKTEYVSAEVAEAINNDDEIVNEEDIVARPPIITVMGHVDHGKTSLLDNIRSANVIAGEAGGITQHIGAYNVQIKSGRKITFLDTPGHEAFTAMRARGAKVTDIAIIIVAADDDVMPQTIEAINHASAANVPIVFAINKVDKPHANPERIKEQLAQMNYLVEDWGGKYQSQEISAKQGTGVEELLEKVLLEADMLDLKANPQRRAVGSVIESSLDKGRGYVSTVLVETGTLKIGDIVLAGTHYGRIKAMFNERNARIEQAMPSEPALILGLSGAPQAGDIFNVLETEQEAREIATRREQLQRELGLRTQKMLTLDDIGRRIAVGNFQELNVIVKGDVDGSVEALSDSLIRLSTEEIQVNVLHKAVGQISESDVVLAAASNAIIIGFQVRPSQAARRLADREGSEIRLYSIIYDAIDEVKSAMEGMLSPEIREEITANVEVREVFKITKVGTVAGCMVREGKIKRSNKIRLIRDGIVIYAGDLGTLKRFKEDVKEVAFGYECGLNITNYNDIQVGDVIEAYEETEVKKKL
jgi:translation initiation factor IF-2